MIKHEQIKKLIDGEMPGQMIHYVVQADPKLIPIMILNVYLNLDSEFINMQAGIKQPQTNLVTNEQPQAVINYFFATTKENFESIFGPYHPAKIINFKMG